MMFNFENFIAGFEKRALQNTRLKEDLATAGTSLLPFGTTLHTALKDKKSGDRGWEWGGRILGGGVGAIPGKSLIQHGMHSNSKGKVLGGVLATLAGGIGGEVLANRLIHKGKYDAKGNLKAQYKSKK
jgi:hypothetical protein